MQVPGVTATVQQAVATFQLPVPPNTCTPSGQALVLEVLQIQFDSSSPEFIFPSTVPTPVNAVVVNSSIVELHAGVPPTTPITGGLFDPTVLAHRHTQAIARQSPSNAAAVEFTMDLWERIVTYNLQDGDGHGIIIPSGSIWFIYRAEINSLGAGVTSSSFLQTTAAFRMMYRYKYVSISEYVQMISSL